MKWYFLKTKSDLNISQSAPFKKSFSGGGGVGRIPLNPLSTARGLATRSMSLCKFPKLKNPRYAPELDLHLYTEQELSMFEYPYPSI